MRGPTVESVMTTEVITVGPDTPFKEIVQLLTNSHISAVPVVGAGGEPLGVVSEADLLAKEEYTGGTEPVRLFAGSGRRQRWRKALGLTAAEIMSKPVITVTADTAIAAAAHKLSEAHVRRLFVVGPGGELVGVVARRDMLRVFLRSDEQIHADVASEVLARALWADQNKIQVVVVDGVVTLTGQFERRSEAEIATRLTATRPGVVGVVDQLTYEWDDVAAARAATP
jgi:CBS domain-containing protein